MSTRSRPPDPTPDLFDDERQRAARRSDPPRLGPVTYVLPAELDAALRQLSDTEIKRLGGAVVAELDRRGFGVPLPPASRYSAPPVSKSSKAPAKSRVPPPAQGPLTAAKVNAIKSAFRAGLKPNAIARQFGVSLGAIREALTEVKQK
jgi:hypothetical protein